MLSTSPTVATEVQIEEACRHFLQQVQVLFPLDTLTVTLLGPDLDYGRVAFTWKPEWTSTLMGMTSTPTSTELKNRSTISIPLRGNYGLLGSVLITIAAGQEFTQCEHRLVGDVIKQLAVRLENIRLHQEVQTSNMKARILARVNQLLASTIDLENLFTSLMDCLGEELVIDQGRLSWIKDSGYDIASIVRTLGSEASPAKSHHFNGSSGGSGARVILALEHRAVIMGQLELIRIEEAFTTSERDLLQAVGRHIAPAVHDMAGKQWSSPKPLERNVDSVGRLGHSVDEADIDDLAHALYSPLTSIKGYTDTLLQPGLQWSEETTREFLNTINQAADRLDQAIRDLLLPAQRYGPFAESCPRETSVQDLFQQVELALPDPGSPTHTYFLYDRDLPKVGVAPQLLKRVISHLVDWAESIGKAPASWQVLAEACTDSALISLGFQVMEQNENLQVSPSLTRPDADLRVAASRHLLKTQGITLEVERPGKDQVLLRFRVPFSQEWG